MQQCIQPSGTNFCESLISWSIFFLLVFGLSTWFLEGFSNLLIPIMGFMMAWKYCPGDDNGRETPLPIPNREVKPTSAENTICNFGEDRSSPG